MKEEGRGETDDKEGEEGGEEKSTSGGAAVYFSGSKSTLYSCCSQPVGGWQSSSELDDLYTVLDTLCTVVSFVVTKFHIVDQSTQPISIY